MFLEYEDRKEADKRRREQVRALLVEKQLEVEANLRRLAAAGYREDKLMWAYEELLKKRGEAFPGEAYEGSRTSPCVRAGMAFKIIADSTLRHL